LESFADDVRGAGAVCDLGCGPGHVGRYLHDRGVEVRGVDLSPRMVEEARRPIDAVLSALQVAGFTIDGVVEREPYEGVEHASRPAYVKATRPLAPLTFPEGMAKGRRAWRTARRGRESRSCTQTSSSS
jgi:SAM-dependent methyltransferase